MTAHHQVLLHCHVAENLAPFHDMYQPLANDIDGVGTGDVRTIKLNTPRRHTTILCPDQVGDGLERGALASAIGAQQGHALSSGDFGGNAFDSKNDVAVEDFNVVQFKHG